MTCLRSVRGQAAAAMSVAVALLGVGCGADPLDGPGKMTSAAAKPLSFRTAPSDRSIALGGIVEADFNGDGKLDVAGQIATTGGIAILLGDGQGGFKTPTPYLIGRFGPAVVAADLDGDKDVDIVATWWPGAGKRMATLLRNNGDGTFANPSDLDVTEEPGVATGDINGDGAVDLVFVTSTRGLTVLLNDGQGAFAATDYAVPAFPTSPIRVFAVGDLDGDGADDVGFTVHGELTARVQVMFASRDGRLGAPVSYTLSDERDLRAWSIVASDVDRDGRLDLVVGTSRTTLDVAGSFASGTAYLNVLRNTGNGILSLSGTYAVGASGNIGAAGDLDGDGAPDLVISDPNVSGDLRVLLNDGHGSFARPAARLAAGAHATDVAVGDLDGDGWPDLAVAAEGLTVLTNEGNGTFMAAPITSGGQVVALGDLDGDGRSDLYAADRIVGTSILLGRAGGDFTPGTTDDAGLAAGVVLADLDGDEKTDAIVTQYISPRLEGGDVLEAGKNGGYWVRINDGDGHFTAKRLYDVNVEAVAVDDFDGDARPDVAVISVDGRGTFPPRLSIETNNGHGDFSDTMDYAPRGTPSQIAAGDFNRDGKVDLALTSADDGSVDVYLNQGGASFQSPVRYAAGKGRGWAAILAVDLDGDGIKDLAVGNYTSQSVSVLRGHGDGTFAARGDYKVSGPPIALATSDLNGDGQPELIVAVGTSVDILPSSGGGRFAPAQSFVAGGYATSVAVADLNDDGMNDLVVGNANAAACVLINTSK